MTDNDKVYIEKRQYVEKLNEALTMLPQVKAVEYRNIRDKYSEYLRVTYEWGEQIFIDVTGDSLSAITQEVSRILLGQNTRAEVRDQAHVAIVKGWFEAAR